MTAAALRVNIERSSIMQNQARLFLDCNVVVGGDESRVVFSAAGVLGKVGIAGEEVYRYIRVKFQGVFQGGKVYFKAPECILRCRGENTRRHPKE